MVKRIGFAGAGSPISVKSKIGGLDFRIWILVLEFGFWIFDFGVGIWNLRGAVWISDFRFCIFDLA